MLVEWGLKAMLSANIGASVTCLMHYMFWQYLQWGAVTFPMINIFRHRKSCMWLKMSNMISPICCLLSPYCVINYKMMMCISLDTVMCSGLKCSCNQTGSTVAAPWTLDYRLKPCTYQLYCQQQFLMPISTKQLCFLFYGRHLLAHRWQTWSYR